MPESAETEYLLLSVIGLGCLIVTSVIWLSRRRPDSRIRQMIARADWHLEARDFDAARERLEAAEELFGLLHDEAEQRDLHSEIDRRLGSIALENHDYDEAGRRLESAVENCDTLLSSRDPSSVGPLGNLAIVQFEQGNDLGADVAFERILAYEPNEYPPELTLTAELLRDIAMSCLARDFHRWPERLLQRSLEHLDERCDPGGDRRVRTWLDLARARFVVANYNGTRGALDEACRPAGDESGYPTFPLLRGQLALLACEWEEAEEQMQQKHRMARDAFGERSPAAAEALGHLANLRRVQGRFAEARDLSGEGLEILEECFGEEDDQLTWPVMLNTMICTEHGDLPVAERHLERGLEFIRRRRTRANSLLGMCRLIRGIMDLERERLDSAAEALLEARRISESVYGRGHRLTMDSIMILADVRLAQDRVAESVPLADEALSILERHEDTCPHDRAELLMMLARLRMVQGDLSAAGQVLGEVSEIVESHLGPEHQAHAEMLHELGRLRRRQGRPEDAERDFRESLRIHESIRLPQHPAIARVLQDCSELLAELGRDSEAREMHSRSATIRATFG